MTIIDQLKIYYAENPAKALNLLPELFKAEKDGLIIELPCKVGDTVYRVVTLVSGKSLIVEGKMIEYAINRSGKEFYFSEETRYHDIWCDSEYFGKTVFLTREAAEKALKESEK